jgi:hypothetical protein
MTGVRPGEARAYGRLRARGQTGYAALTRQTAGKSDAPARGSSIPPPRAPTRPQRRTPESPHAVWLELRELEQRPRRGR